MTLSSFVSLPLTGPEATYKMKFTLYLYIVSDFQSKSFSAEEFGIKELVPAYLDPNLKLQDLLTGVSFASGAAGYDPITAQLAVYISFSSFSVLFFFFIS